MIPTTELPKNRAVWLHSFCPETAIPGDFRLHLQETPIQTRAYHPGNGSGPGIIVASEITPQLCDFIRAESEDSHERILVLVTGSTALVNGNPWQVLQAGASDLLVWDGSPAVASLIAAKFQRWREIDDLIDSPLVQNSLVGRSRSWKSVLRQLIEVARFTDDPVVLIGETGTGKELAARLIHTLDRKRKNKDLIVLDCTTVVPDLSGSEFFGHEKGSFTGAVSSRDGAFALANGGTLFLDEIGELPLSMQIQLLRVLQEHTYKRVGGNGWNKIDFRLICATNQELRNNVDLGQFRRDLYYRIAHWVIRMPPLHERIEDIIPLAECFMRQARPEREPPELDDKVQEYFLTREYPGNVRDLRNLVFRIMARHPGPGPVTLGDIPSDERPREGVGSHIQLDFGIEQSVRQAVASGLGLREIRKIVEDTSIRIVVENEGGNLQRAAQVLNVTDRTLQKRRADQLKHLKEVASNKCLQYSLLYVPVKFLCSASEFI